MVTPTMAVRRYLFGRSPMRMRTTQFAKPSGRLQFTQSLSLPMISTRPFTMRTKDGEHEVSVALPPNVPQPPDLNHCFERYSLSMRPQDGCSVEECQEVAATLEMYAARIIAGCEQKPYARLVSGKRTYAVQNIKLTVLGCRQRGRHRSTGSRERRCASHTVCASTRLSRRH